MRWGSQVKEAPTFLETAGTPLPLPRPLGRLLNPLAMDAKGLGIRRRRLQNSGSRN